MKSIDASILLTTYNHGKYISQCINGILGQVTNFNIELVWYDDASADNTIEEGERALADADFPIIRVHNKNNRIQKKIPNRLDKFEKCRGEFVFFIEGDDFWIAPEKIDIQIEAMKMRSDINLSFTPAIIVNEKGYDTGRKLAFHADDLVLIDVADIISGDGGFMPTASLCVRRSIFDEFPEFYYGYMPVGDYPTQVLSALSGGAIYLPVCSTAYRENSTGSWSMNIMAHKVKRLNFELEFLDLILKMRGVTGVRYKKAYDKVFMSHYFSLIEMALSLENSEAVHGAALCMAKYIDQ